MQTVMFHSTIFGPIHSRRLGTSLGVNLTPNDGKICSFDCLYCEAGFNAQGPGTTGMATTENTLAQLEAKLTDMKSKGEGLDVITFSGNGEPTLHPDFERIIDGTIALRDRYFPNAKVSVLTNATRIGSDSVFRALEKVDNNILKLDSAVEATVQAMDRPNPGYSLQATIDRMAQFGKKGIIQTMFARGEHEGVQVDNTTEAEVDALIEAYRRINPGQIMIYTIDRPTPAVNLHRIPKEEMEAIGARIQAATGIPVQVSI